MYKFTHVNATELAGATAVLAKGKAQVVAGGTDLITYMRGMFTPNPPSTLVNIKTIANLSYIKEEGGVLKIGALTTLTAIANSSVVKATTPHWRRRPGLWAVWNCAMRAPSAAISARSRAACTTGMTTMTSTA